MCVCVAATTGPGAARGSAGVGVGWNVIARRGTQRPSHVLREEGTVVLPGECEDGVFLRQRQRARALSATIARALPAHTRAPTRRETPRGEAPPQSFHPGTSRRFQLPPNPQSPAPSTALLLLRPRTLDARERLQLRSSVEARSERCERDKSAVFKSRISGYYLSSRFNRFGLQISSLR